jgi:hypothetical protein
LRHNSAAIQNYRGAIVPLFIYPKIKLMNYPFKEGETYYTIEKDIIVKSYWDYVSEELYSKDKIYFRTIQEAEMFHVKQSIK